MVEQSGGRRDIVVVSSDKSLTSRVKQLGAQVISSRSFRALLQQVAGLKREKPGDNERVNVEEWLKIFQERES
jgi:predicted RNA-binding protein with PIN domain